MDPREIKARIDRMPKERQPAKRLELEFAMSLFGTGISRGQAFDVAERLAKDPVKLAERLHRIANEFLLSSPTDGRLRPSRYEIVGLTKAEAQRALEAIAGCVLTDWRDDDECVLTDELRARPMVPK